MQARRIASPFGPVTLAIGLLVAQSAGLLSVEAPLSFKAPRSYPVGLCRFSAPGDFNHDGIPDMVATELGAYDAIQKRFVGNAVILLGRGDGTFAPGTRYSVGEEPRSIAVGDFNLDGKPDVAVANTSSDSISVLLNRGDGTFGSAGDYEAGSGPISLASADFDSDGIPDLAVACIGTNALCLVL